MSEGDWFLVAVVAVAFVAGYSVVSFIVKKMKGQDQSREAPRGGQSQTDSGTSAKASGTDEQSEAHQNQTREDQQRQWERDEARRRSETWESQTEEKRHAAVLGLRGKVTPADLKRAYRELLAKYHPDKVNHLGAEFQRIAEVRTREIIAAYEFFQTKYDIR